MKAYTPLIPFPGVPHEVRIYDGKGNEIERRRVRDARAALELCEQAPGQSYAFVVSPTVGELIREHLREIINLCWLWLLVQTGRLS